MLRPTRTKKNRHEEYEHCLALMSWVRYALRKHPELRLLYHVPNGAVLGGKMVPGPDGRMVPMEGARLKAMGTKPGIPDYHMPVARGGYLSLYVEMKKLGDGGGRTSKAQREVIEALREEGNRVEVCHGWEAARAVILDYLDSGATLHTPAGI